MKEADEEVLKSMVQEALFEKYLQKSGTDSNSNVPVLVVGDGGDGN